MSERPGPRSDQTLNESQLPQQAPLPPVALDTLDAGAPETSPPT